MMKDNDLQVTEDELHAFVDGELPADRRAAVEAWLAAHPEDAARVGAWRLQSDAIRARYGDVAAQPIPMKLKLDRMSSAARSWKIAAAAAVVAAFFLGGMAGWMARDSAAGGGPSEFEKLTAQALYAHKVYAVEVRHPVEVAAAESEHLQQWLSKRVGSPLRAPNLERLGLNLVGGRLLPTPTGAAAAFFMYENASGERFTLYCAKANTANTAMHLNAVDKTGAIYWVDGNVAYVVSGASERKQLWKVARAAYEQIEPRIPQEERGS
jgi:anti-sigma factor RsiW